MGTEASGKRNGLEKGTM